MKKVIQSLLGAAIVCLSLHASANDGQIYNDWTWGLVDAQLQTIQNNLTSIQGRLMGVTISAASVDHYGIADVIYWDQNTEKPCHMDIHRLGREGDPSVYQLDEKGCSYPVKGAYRSIPGRPFVGQLHAITNLRALLRSKKVRTQLNNFMYTYANTSAFKRFPDVTMFIKSSTDMNNLDDSSYEIFSFNGFGVKLNALNAQK